jgi:hypothetical protein
MYISAEFYLRPIKMEGWYKFTKDNCEVSFIKDF